MYSYFVLRVVLAGEVPSIGRFSWYVFIVMKETCDGSTIFFMYSHVVLRIVITGEVP